MPLLYAEVSADYHDKRVAGQSDCQVVFSGIDAMTLRRNGEMFTVAANMIIRVIEGEQVILKESILVDVETTVDRDFVQGTADKLAEKTIKETEISESTKKIWKKLDECHIIFSEIRDELTKIATNYENKNI